MLRRPTGRPLRLRDLAALTGWSRAKLLADIKGEYLKAKIDPDSRIFQYLVQWEDAQKYLRAMGVL